MSNRTVTLSLSLLLAAAATGCQDRTGVGAYRDRRVDDKEMVTMHFDEQARLGVIAERTLYPHHFAVNGAGLNELGEQHLAVLAGTYTRGPVTISVARGDVGPELYEQRVQTVLSELEAAGVDTAAVAITEDLPAGPGTPSTRAVTALQPAGSGQSAAPTYLVPAQPAPGGNR